MMSAQETARELIRRLGVEAARQGFSGAKAAQSAGLSENYYNSILNRGNASLIHMLRVGKELGLDLRWVRSEE